MQRQALPLCTSSGRQRKQYVLDDRGRVRAVPLAERRGVEWATQLHRWKAQALGALLPRAADVTPDYWRYSQWRAGHRFFSAVLGNFSTQSLLTAVGVGKGSSLPAAAALNWMLKDGLGRLGRLTISAKFGSHFDASLKRFRFGTSVLFSASALLEYATPFFPQHFLLLASLANLGKSVSLSTHVSTQPSVSKSFSRSGKLADITAKAQAQQVVADTAGLLACAALTWAARGAPRARRVLPLLAFPLAALGDLACIRQELKCLHLRTLSLERADLLCTLWLQTGRVPLPSEVSAYEPLLFPLHTFGAALPLRLAPLEAAVRDAEGLAALERSKKYALGCHPRQWPCPWKHDNRALYLTLDSRASTVDVFQGILQAAAWREAVARGGSREHAAAESEAQARRHARPLLAAARRQGWSTGEVLLSDAEDSSYRWLGDHA